MFPVKKLLREQTRRSQYLRFMIVHRNPWKQALKRPLKRVGFLKKALKVRHCNPMLAQGDSSLYFLLGLLCRTIVDTDLSIFRKGSVLFGKPWAVRVDCRPCQHQIWWFHRCLSMAIRRPEKGWEPLKKAFSKRKGTPLGRPFLNG